MITEADTCRRYVLPKLYVAGWKDIVIDRSSPPAATCGLHTQIRSGFHVRDHRSQGGIQIFRRWFATGQGLCRTLGLKFASPPIATVSSSFDLRQRQGTGAGTLPTTDELRKGEDNIWHLESESRAHCVHGDADTAVADQRRIVAELYGLLSRVDALKTQVETSTELVALLPSILAEALRVNLSRRGAW